MTVLSQRRLLQWQGTSDKELIITKVTKGNDPLANFYDDAEATQEIIEVEEQTPKMTSRRSPCSPTETSTKPS